MTKTKDGLIIFVKNPKLGHAKTRIAKAAGDEKALDIYKQLLKITADTVAPLQVDKYVYYSQYVDDRDLWDNELFIKRKQSEGELGHRMTMAFEQLSTDYDRMIIIGSDCPYLTTEKIEKAFAALEAQQVVIGPVADGGFYLLGMDQHYPSLFEDMEYSTTTVYRETIDRIEKSKLNYKVLGTLEDIDYYEDWKKYLIS